MIDLFDLYNRFSSENNLFQGGIFRPQRDFEKAVNSISLDIWNEWTSQVNKSQEIEDNLSVFLKTSQLLVQATKSNYGLVSYPKEYQRFSAARVLIHKDECFTDTGIAICDESGECVCNETEDQKHKRIEAYKDGIVEANINKVDSSRWSAVLEHVNKRPTLQTPFMTQFSDGFKVAPRQVTVVVLDYYVKPKYANFVYTLVPGDEQTGSGDYMVYDPNKSDKLEWNESMIPIFLQRLQTWYAKYSRSEFLIQTSKL